MQITAKKTREMAKRLFMRSVILLALTIIGFAAMDIIVELERANDIHLVSRFPEIMLVLRALTMLTWIEISVQWIRLALAPKLDMQAFACMAYENNDVRACVAVYAINSVVMLSRILFVLVMAELV